MKIGAQLYTVRDYAQTVPDLAVTLRKIAEMGYRTVQCSQVGPIDPYLIKEMLDENNLQCVMTHVAPDRLLNDLPTVIAEHRILGCTNIGLGAMPERYRGSLEGCLAMVRNFSPVAKNIRDAGMQFHYHNHDIEFIREGRQTLLDIFLENMPETNLLLCAFWAWASGVSPEHILSQYSGRITAIHLKDMAVIPGCRSVGSGRTMVPVLEGNMDYISIVNAAENCGVDFALVEQDTCQESPFTCLQKSLANLQSIGCRT